MSRGFSIPTVLIVVLILIALPVLFLFLTDGLEFSSVKGTSTSLTENSNPGFSVLINSKKATWDLVEYLCETLDECLESLTGGHRLGTVSGGGEDSHEVVVEASTVWKDYEYIKYYVAPSWISSNSTYNVIELGEIAGSQKKSFKVAGKTYEVVVFPVSEVLSSFGKSAVFEIN